ncbi:MAG: class I SAM-dependent methyltransferase [Bradymonadia bacterium]
MQTFEQATEESRRMARLYALIHRGNPGDVECYVAACDGATRVLELGCGEGRVLEALVTHHPSLEISGLDLDPGALAEACTREPLAQAMEAGRVQLHQADMRDFELEGSFDRIIIPYNGLYTLGSLDGVRQCLATAARHLTPDGALIFDGYAVDDDAADAELWVDPPDPNEVAEDPWCEGGFSYLITVLDLQQRVDVYEREIAVGEPRRLNVRYRFVIRSGSPFEPPTGEPEVIEQVVGHHFITPGMVPALIRDAGLKLVSMWGEFDGRPFDDESERLVVTARKTNDTGESSR